MLLTCRTADWLRMQSNPAMATVLLTYSCSNRCVFCGPSKKRNLPVGNLAHGDHVRTWMERCASGNAKVVVFSGAADPFTHKDLPSLVSYANQLNIRPFCYTQAHISQRRAKEIWQAGLSEIMVSIHGHNAAVHDRNTRSPGSFDLTMRGLAYLQDAGLYTMSNTVVTRYNVTHLDEIVDMLAFDHKVDEIALSFPRVEGSVRDNLNCIPSFDIAAEKIKSALQRLRLAGIRATVEYMPFCYLDPDTYVQMPDLDTFYLDNEHDIVIRPSQVEWHYPSCCGTCNWRTDGCYGVDQNLPFKFQPGEVRHSYGRA